MAELTNYLTDRLLLEETEKDILVDADALVALAKKDDSNHKKAVRINNTLQKKKVSYYLSPFTIPEATTVLSHKVSHQAAKNFLKEMRKISLPVLELPNENLDLADRWFFKQKKKGISYFDCYNMALFTKYYTQIEAIFSFDSIYKKNGFKTTMGLL